MFSRAPAGGLSQILAPVARVRLSGQSLLFSRSNWSVCCGAGAVSIAGPRGVGWSRFEDPEFWLDWCNLTTENVFVKVADRMVAGRNRS